MEFQWYDKHANPAQMEDTESKVQLCHLLDCDLEYSS